jgi:predicted ATPase with chaperone activity
MSAYPDYVHQTLARVRDEGQMSQLNLSARAYHRTRSVKLARTIADLAEALQYRPKIMLG